MIELKKYGLTNVQIAEGIKELSDDDFYEVFEELKKIYNIKNVSIGEWLDVVLEEIREQEQNEIKI